MNVNKDFALLIIDMDREFWSKEMKKQHPHIPRNIKKLLKLCRAIGIEVIHIRVGCWGAPTGNSHLMFHEAGPLVWANKRSVVYCKNGYLPGGVHQTMDWAEAVPGEKIFYKAPFDGFLNPDLGKHLKKRNIKMVLTCGFTTSVCVLFTTISATERALFAAMVEDCTGDLGKAHKQTLDHYVGMNFFDRVKVDSIKKMLPKWKARNKKYQKIRKYHKLFPPLA